MAQNAKISALTDELIHSILKFDPDANRQAYRHAKEIATRGLRAHQYARTNQFEVQATYAGLDEKFRVLNRDDLADALAKRVKEINQKRSKWTPEYLSLLLQLSDQPTENSKVEALELLRPPEPPPDLTWKEILEEDPYSDEEIWKDVDYAVESSEDEQTPRKREPVKLSPASSVEESDVYDPETCVVPVPKGLVRELTEAQFWKREQKEGEDKIEITELQAIRETLFMLAGLRTSLYHTDKERNTIRVDNKYILSHAIHTTTHHLLSEMTDTGRKLLRLRLWIKRPSSLPLIQTFEAAVRSRLASYDQALAALQHKYIVPEVPLAVSLLELNKDITTMSRPILRLAELISEIEPQLLVNPFIHLETLFNQISLAQMTLDQEIFEFFSQIFFECLQTYLKPICHWMESGELGTNDETFFVFENDSSNEASSLWHDRYVLRRGKENALRSPTFLQPAARKIFNTGKSVVFLKELGLYRSGLQSSEVEPRLNHNTVCGASEGIPLSPFSELFQAAFQTWIGSKYSLASTILCKHLFSVCELMRILSNFKMLYLGANGSIFQDFADAVFERMDAGQRSWNDRFLLTELARGIFAVGMTQSHAEKIVVRSSRSKAKGGSVKRLANVSLDYALPWPIMNIIQRSSIPIYQQIFTFLLQTYRMKYLLQRVSTRAIRQIKNFQHRQLSYKLRQRLVWFTSVIRSYLTEAVIELSSQEMVDAMLKAEDIDGMSNIHIKYIAKLQDQALLSENLRPIHKAIISLLDLGVLYSQSHSTSSEHPVKTYPSQPARKIPEKHNFKASRRKSFIPAIVEDASSDSDGNSADEVDDTIIQTARTSNLEDALKTIEIKFESLLPFVTAGLRNVGRVGAEPMWGMLAERLEWDGRRERVL